MSKKGNPCTYVLPCRSNTITLKKVKGREQIIFDALPRYVTYSFMPPAYYAKGYRILPAYKTQFDFTEMKKLLFLEDKEKWGTLRARLPYPEQRVVDLPGTRDLDYKNYCMRSLTPESAMSWRKSIATSAVSDAVCCSDREKPPCNNKNCPYK